VNQQLVVGFPKPGRALKVVLLVVFAVWLFFAAGIHWGGADRAVFGLFVGSDAILSGELWRLFTTFLVHQPVGNGATGHLITTMLGLYFLGSSLEESWGGRRFVLFLLGAGLFGAAFQVLLGALVPQLHAQEFYGGLGVVDAVAVAWAMSFRDRQVRLFFVLPVTGKGLLAIVVVMNVLFVIAGELHREGLVTPFGGMLAGYLGADGSPLRSAYLRWRFKRLQGQSAALRGVRTSGKPKLSVIQGGQPSGKGKPDKSMLN